MQTSAGACKNCHRFTPMPFKHSFSTELGQTKNQSWHTDNSSWIVTPTAAVAPALIGATFCSGDCLYSYLFSHELLSTRSPDVSLHFFKRTDEQRQWLASTLLREQGGGDGGGHHRRRGCCSRCCRSDSCRRQGHTPLI